MAEAIGIVASGITIGTLATGITSSIVKLKSYWDQVQDAPDDIHDLIEELEILSYLLADIEDDQRQTPMSSLILDSTSTSWCLQYCKQGADRLKELTDNLSTDLDASSKVKRKRVSAKVVLKKRQIDMYKAKLERAIRLLSLSHQLYTTALLRLQPDIIVTKLSQTTTSGKGLLYEVLDPDHSSALRLDAAGNGTITTLTAIKMRSDQAWNLSNLFGTFQYSRIRYSVVKRKQSRYRDRRREVEEIRATYCGPSWLFNRVWEVRAVKSSLGWTFCPRTYNIIPEGSPVFKLIRSNDVKGLQELFNEMKASPFDCDECGSTPLHYAAIYRNYDVCDFLIREGADPDYGHLTPLEIVLYDDKCNSNAVGVLRLLLNETEREPNLAWYRGSKEGFSMSQQDLDPLYYQRPLEERFEVAMSLADCGNGPEVLRLALARGALPSLAHCMTNCNGETLLHAVASGWVERTRFSDSSRLQEEYELDPMDRQLFVFVKELIVQGANLHSISSTFATPFVDVLRRSYGLTVDRREGSMSMSINLASMESSVSAFVDGKSMEYPVSSIHKAAFFGYRILPQILYTWLECLQECGVDLHEYGRKERDLHLQGLVSWNWLIGWSPRRRCFLTNLTYGPSPSDWKFDLVFRREDAIESAVKVPGGWVEDDISEQSEDIPVEKEEGNEHEERDP